MYVLSIAWLTAALGIILGYFAVSYPKSFIPKLIPDLYLFGKIRNLDGYGLTKSVFQVPKRWFCHFYLTGIIVNTSVLVLAVHTVLNLGQWPSWFQGILNSLGHSTGQVEPWPVVLALLMEEVQVVRRFLECRFVNTYSNSYMSIVIYVIGHLFYSFAGMSVMVLMSTHQMQLGDLVGSTTWYQMLAISLFVWASWKQYKVNRIMAKLRHDKNGNVNDTKHHIPHGDLFEYCSCPHYFMEIMIYVAMASLFAWRHEICVCMFTFVFVNQTIAGYLTHYWYKQNFNKYPASRTAIIPFLF